MGRKFWRQVLGDEVGRRCRAQPCRLDSRLRGWLLYLRRGRPVGLGRMDQSRVAWGGQDVPRGMGMPWEGL